MATAALVPTGGSHAAVVIRRDTEGCHQPDIGVSHGSVCTEAMHSVVVLGAGFGGLELAAALSESLADEISVVLIDKNAGFTFGFSKLDVLFNDRKPGDVQIPYQRLSLPSVTFRREEVVEIDPRSRRVLTDRTEYVSDFLVVALGADYDPYATPGFVRDGFEFYSVNGARRLARRLDSFAGGAILLSILGVPFKCPPAPYEAALLLDTKLRHRGVRDRSHIHVTSPMPSPIPVSPSTSQALVQALSERGIDYSPGLRIASLDPNTHVATTSDGRDLRYDLFIGVPTHRVPFVVEASGLTAGGTDGWIAVDPDTLATPFPGVYAIGDCADAPVPRAGVFAEGAARTVAAGIIAQIHGSPQPEKYLGQGACYIEFGDGLVAKVDIDFRSGPQPFATFTGPSTEFANEKAEFGSTRRARWFSS